MKPNYRRCISCRRIAPKVDFWRVVRVYPTQTVQLDQGMGRSAYICPQISCLLQAQKKNRLGKILKAKIPETIYQTLRARLDIS
ncbi:MAG: YlxR family protein, partial [Cyanobacteria bacterium J083]